MEKILFALITLMSIYTCKAQVKKLVKPMEKVSFKEEVFCQSVELEIYQLFTIDSLLQRNNYLNTKISVLQEMNTLCITTLDSCNKHIEHITTLYDTKDSLYSALVTLKNEQISKISKDKKKVRKQRNASILIAILVITTAIIF